MAARATTRSRAAPVRTSSHSGPNRGNDTITDLTDGKDRIDLSSLEGIAGFGDLEIETYGATTMIDLTCYGGGIVRLEDTADASFDVADFVFYEPSVDAAPIDGM